LNRLGKEIPMSERAKKIFVRTVAALLAVLMIGSCATVIFSLLSF